MKKSDMLAKAATEFPQFFTWAFVSGHNRVESLLMPVTNLEDEEDDNWYPGAWECDFNSDGDIVTLWTCKVLKEMPFITKEECEMAIQRMPF